MVMAVQLIVLLRRNILALEGTFTSLIHVNRSAGMESLASIFKASVMMGML
jgi:hypothetical protein